MFFLKSRNERVLKQYGKIVEQVKAKRDSFAKLSDNELLQISNSIKERLSKGERFEKTIPESLGLICVAADRVLGMNPYDVQIIGALALLDHKIAEMRTGEGKTLTAAMAAFARSLEGKGVHVVTVNDYLAKRDSLIMAPMFKLLGQTTGVVYGGMTDDMKLSSYADDITYATNNEIGFDYLRDNMVIDRTEKRQRGLYYAIVDEVDSILIDEARTPLVISGPSGESITVYNTMDEIAKQLVLGTEEENNGDYWKDGKTKQVNLTEDGMEKAEQLLKKYNLINEEDSLYATHNISLVYHLNAALRANSLYHKDVAYLIRDGQAFIVDEFTGRAMPGRRWGEGLHQAIEAKEGLEIHPENQTVASITLQNLFRSYTHLAGMTGTADTEASEFMEIYGLEVIIIPPHKKLAREDNKDMIFLNMKGKLKRVISDLIEIHETGRPILVGTASIEMSETISNLLKEKGIKHEVLNAKHHEKEARIIADAGKLGSITIATNMAGRGTDIMLGGSQEEISELRNKINDNFYSEEEKEEFRKELEAKKKEWQENHDKVVELGGLHIIGTERHESRRIDNQLRGRAGRQGDPGSSQFYICFEDHLMALFASDFAKKTLANMGMSEDDVITLGLVTKQIEKAQKSVETHNFNARKALLDYDDISNEQRKVFYSWREDILSVNELEYYFYEFLEDTLNSNVEGIFIKNGFDGENLWNELNEFLLKISVPYFIIKDLDHEKLTEPDQVVDELMNKLSEWLEKSQQEIGAEWLYQVRGILLTAHDLHWREHLAGLDTLRKGIHLRGFGQKQPKQEYKKDSFEMFKSMLDAARYDATRGILSMTIHMLTRKIEIEQEEVNRRLEEESAMRRSMIMFSNRLSVENLKTENEIIAMENSQWNDEYTKKVIRGNSIGTTSLSYNLNYRLPTIVYSAPLEAIAV